MHYSESEEEEEAISKERCDNEGKEQSVNKLMLTNYTLNRFWMWAMMTRGN